MAASSNPPSSSATPGDWDFWTQGLDRKFFSRVYLRSTQIGTLAVLAALLLDQRLVALGLLAGLVIGLFSLWTAELTVRLLFRGGSHAHLKLAIGAFVKMPIGITGLMLVAWASYNGHMNIFGVVGGTLIVHGTMLVSVIATALAAEGSNRERYK
jgi:hypothetical protein